MVTALPALRVRRRAFLRLALSLAIGQPALQVRGEPARLPRVVALDLASIDVAAFIGARLVGAAMATQYRDGNSDVTLASDVLDIGSTAEPNLELMQAINPDLLLYAWPTLSASSFSRISPALRLDVFTQTPDRYETFMQAALSVAKQTGDPDTAYRAVERAHSLLEDIAKKISRHKARPIFLVNSNIDGFNLRVFGEHSLFGSVLRRVGLDNAWSGDDGIWGWRIVPPEALQDSPDARIIDITQYWDGYAAARKRLTRSIFWKTLPQVRAGRVSTLPPLAILGGPASAMRFASLLMAALATEAG